LLMPSWYPDHSSPFPKRLRICPNWDKMLFFSFNVIQMLVIFAKLKRILKKMAIIITDECINCGACEPECPNNAIYEGGAEWRYADGTSLTGMVDLPNRSVRVDADANHEPV